MDPPSTALWLIIPGTGLLNCGCALGVGEGVQPSEEMLEIPGMRDELRRPMMLLVRAKKPAA